MVLKVTTEIEPSLLSANFKAGIDTKIILVVDGQ